VNVLLVHCHPCENSFSAHLRDRSAAALRAGGHVTDVLDLYAEGFSPELTPFEHAHHLGPPQDKPDVADHVRRLRAADALVFVYPTWIGGQPAMLKGWFDRVWIAGVAYERPPDGGPIKPLLRRVRRIAVVTTHGSSKWVNALEGEPGKRVMTRTLRLLCHPLARTRWIALYGIDRSSESQRTAFVMRVEQRLARL
jgi:NAD(P)H dehydrogenase (quinone)